MLDGAVEQDAEIVPVHTEYLADVVFVSFFKKNNANHVAFPPGEGGDMFADLVHDFGLNREAFYIQYLIGWVNLIFFRGLVLKFVAVSLMNHEIADRIYISADAFWVADAVFGLQSFEN